MGPLSTGEVVMLGAGVVLAGWAIIGLVRKVFGR